MAWSWTFALWLVLTLVALLFFSQPLFQSAPEVGHKPEDLEIAPQKNFVTFQAIDSMEGERQHMARKVIQQGEREQQQQQPQEQQSICKGKRKVPLSQMAFSKTTTTVANDQHYTVALASTRSVARPKILPAKRPPRSLSVQFQPNRMVPSGPNPLHNNNRSQVLLP